MIETIIPRDEAHWLEMRIQDVTSTESPALFGLSPYITEFELWHRKNEQQASEFTMNERMLWGTRLQDAIGFGIASDKQWHIRRMTEYMRDTDLKMGSSFDFAIMDERVPGQGGAVTDTGLLEIKNVDAIAFKNGWEDDGVNIEAPPHIEIQVQHQLAVTGLPFAFIGAFIGGNRYELIKRDRDEKVIKAIKRKVGEFWDSIFNNEPPVPNFEKDYEFIQSLYAFADPNKRVDVSGDHEIAELVQEYKECSESLKAYENRKQAAKAQLLMKIGDAEKATGLGFKISATMVGPCHVEFDRKGHRDFRIHFSKDK